MKTLALRLVPTGVDHVEQLDVVARRPIDLDGWFRQYVDRHLLEEQIVFPKDLGL